MDAYKSVIDRPDSPLSNSLESEETKNGSALSRHDMSKFGILIQQCRIKADKTLHAAADLLGVSAFYLSEVECGKKPPFSRARIEKLAKFYGADSEPLIVQSWRERGLIDLELATASTVKTKAVFAIACGNLSEAQWKEIHRVVGGDTLAETHDAPRLVALAKAVGQ